MVSAPLQEGSDAVKRPLPLDNLRNIDRLHLNPVLLQQLLGAGTALRHEDPPRLQRHKVAAEVFPQLSLGGDLQNFEPLLLQLFFLHSHPVEH